MSKDAETFDAWCRRWLEAHPEPVSPTLGMAEIAEVVTLMNREEPPAHPASTCWLLSTVWCDAQGPTCGSCPGYERWRASLPAWGWA